MGEHPLRGKGEERPGKGKNQGKRQKRIIKKKREKRLQKLTMGTLYNANAFYVVFKIFFFRFLKKVQN